MSDKKYWCCKEEFGFHEKSCENYNNKDEVRRLEEKVVMLQEIILRAKNVLNGQGVPASTLICMAVDMLESCE